MSENRLAGGTFGHVVQPRYVQLARIVRADIDRGVLRPGDRLPGEREICRRFEVSRATVRRALEELESLSYVRADGTRGWFVTALVEPNALMGFTDLASQRGLTASSRVIARNVREATLDETEDLAAPPGAQVLELERVRLMDGVAVGWQRAVVAAWLAPTLLEMDYASGSIYQGFLAHGIVPTRADYDVRAAGADKRKARLLNVPAGKSVLLIKATTSDQEGRRIEISEGAFLGDRYRFSASVGAGTTSGEVRPR